MRSSLIGLAAGLILLLTACGQAEDPAKARAARAKSPYFNMVGLLAKLEKNAKGHAFRKRAVLGDKFEETTTPQPDYHRELALFYSADLTKPGWQGLFSTKRNGASTAYVAQDDRPELRVLMVNRDVAGAVRSVDVNLAQHNYLFDSDASGTIWLRYENGEALLDSVSLQGMQKIILSSPFTYVLQGKTL